MKALSVVYGEIVSLPRLQWDLMAFGSEYSTILTNGAIGVYLFAKLDGSQLIVASTTFDRAAENRIIEMIAGEGLPQVTQKSA